MHKYHSYQTVTTGILSRCFCFFRTGTLETGLSLALYVSLSLSLIHT